MRRAITGLALVLFLLLGLAQSQATLSVNGREVPGLTLELVPGVSYAPANAFAAALGARLYLDYGSGLASLELGGRLAVLPTGDAASAGPTTLRVNGAERTGRPGVFSDGVLYLPVSDLVQIFGGYTSYIPDGERVMVVMPRGRLVSMEASRRGASERLILRLDSNVPFAVSYQAPLGNLEIRFDRTESRSGGSVDGALHFTRATIIEDRGGIRVSVSLDDNIQYQVYTVPSTRGYDLVVDLFQETEGAPEEAPRPLVVLDPAHGGADVGEVLAAGAESELTLEVARAVEEILLGRGFRVELSRTQDINLPLSVRAGRGVGAELFVSIHLHDSDTGAVYFLSEADGAASLDMAIRQNAAAELESTTDALRRRLLLNLIPDLDLGRRYATGMQAELFAAAAIGVAEPQGAPLAVLAGAAGRGMLVELPAAVSDTDVLATALADAIAAVLGGAP